MELLSKRIFSLCSEFGASGNEKDVSEFLTKKLSKHMSVKKDNLGNVIGESFGNGVHIALDAHMDQIGFIVVSVEDDGFLKVTPCGGIDKRVLAAHEVTVWGKDKIFGVITSTPPHLVKDEDGKKASEIEDLSIDIGMSAKKAKETVRVGDRVTLKSPQLKLLNNRISCNTADDRAGVLSILRCLEILENQKHNCKLTVMFTVQEETGGSGAKVGGYIAQADEAFSVDVGFAKAPDVTKESTSEIGKGTMIGISPVLDYEMSRTLERIAKEKNIDFQLEIMGAKTGTNADSIQTAGKGTKTALLSIPMRNMHTGCELIQLDDIESTAHLMANYILERGGLNND
ncbi:MAG TPA: M20/M25/M40 family metallo-hydrolase [Clostridia bacterium]|nr:M20/M25/M40 family metallo-hydrolase [Clostridia bacterium]